MESNWISVKSKLPNYGQSVIAKTEEFEIEGSYEEHTECMLGSRAGAQGQGFQDDENKLFIADVTHWKPKIYRCGWCGCFTDKLGKVLQGGSFNSSLKIHTEYGDIYTIKTNGYCCGSMCGD